MTTTARLTLTPYYRFSRGLLNTRLGVDAWTRLRRRAFRRPVFCLPYGPRRASRLAQGGEWAFSSTSSEARSSGRSPRSMRLDYYATPLLADTRPVYSPLDASAGANFGPFAGFSAGVAFRYRISRRTPTGGWYAWRCSTTAVSPLPGMCRFRRLRSRRRPLRFVAGRHRRCTGTSLAMHAGYRLGSILELEAEGTYQPQDGEKGYFNGYDRPRWTASVAATVKPVEKLSFRSNTNTGACAAYTRRPDVSVPPPSRAGFRRSRIPATARCPPSACPTSRCSASAPDGSSRPRSACSSRGQPARPQGRRAALRPDAGHKRGRRRESPVLTPNN